MKRKEYNAVKNKIVNVEQVLSRGDRIPSIEIIFKENGFLKPGGHKVYVDYECAKNLVNKLQTQLEVMRSKYFPVEFYDSIKSKIDVLD